MMDVQNVILSFAQLPPSSIVQGFGRGNINILCSLIRVVFIVLVWQWAAQFNTRISGFTILSLLLADFERIS